MTRKAKLLDQIDCFLVAEKIIEADYVRVVEESLYLDLTSQLGHHLFIETVAVDSLESADETCLFMLSHENRTELAFPELLAQTKIRDSHFVVLAVLSFGPRV